jgi:hypothetical protein
VRVTGDLHLADIGIPPKAYERLGLLFDEADALFGSRYWVRLKPVSPKSE